MNISKPDTRLISFSTAAALLGAGFAMAMSASADTGTGWGMRTGGCDPERHDAVESAIESGDYEAWRQLMTSDGRSGGRVASVVTVDNFGTFAAMHAAMEDGDHEHAQELREEIGLGTGRHKGTGFRGGMAHGMPRAAEGWNR